MAAQGIDVLTIRFPDPDTIDYRNTRFDTVPQNVSFRYPIRNNIRTLSPKDSGRGTDPYGIIFVPYLQSEGCKQSELKHVPANATRHHNLPQGTNYSLLGLAPWFSPTCMHEYLESARSFSSMHAILVYQPGKSAAMPPSASDASWALGDGGAWKKANEFPTYAIMPISGSILVEQLALFSGNITDAPDGEDLASMYRATDYVRLWATIRTESENKLPSLWVLVVIVLALLVFVLLATSTFMHVVQRRRRENLRRRIVNGELNLETVGVKRMTVPREYLEKLPLHSYTSPADPTQEKATPQVPAQAHTVQDGALDPVSGVSTAFPARQSSPGHVGVETAQPLPTLSQPTCPICLDDFEPNQTQVRELPCRHIYHPECIDPFLLRNSSLCPLCKESVLPKGYCPTRITNMMVRRERLLRRLGNHSESGRPSHRRSHGFTLGALGSFGRRMGGAGAASDSSNRNPPPDIEMAIPQAGQQSTAPETREPNQANGGTAPAPASSNAECPSSSIRPPNRRERAQERAVALLGDRHVPHTDEEEEHTLPRWKRGLRKIFPGFR